MILVTNFSLWGVFVAGKYCNVISAFVVKKGDWCYVASLGILGAVGNYLDIFWVLMPLSAYISAFAIVSIAILACLGFSLKIIVFFDIRYQSWPLRVCRSF